MDESCSRKYTVLIVDDDEDLLHLLALTIGERSYPIMASSVKQARVALTCYPIDVVVCDHHLPDMSGLEFLQEVEKTYPNVGRILITGDSDIKTSIEARIEQTLHMFLLKPVSSAEIWDAIRMVGEMTYLESNK